MTSPARGGPDTAGVDPAEIRRQRTLGWPDFHPEDYCHHCGHPNPNWWVDSDEWRTATAHVDRGEMTILCPSCFCSLWEQVTGRTAIIWRLSIDPRSRDAGGPDTAGTAREQVARLLCEQRNGPGGWDYEPGRRYWLEDADELLALPVVQRLAVEKAAEVVEALRPHIPPSTDPNRRTAVIVRSTLNQAARVVRAAALAAAAQPGDGRTGE